MDIEEEKEEMEDVYEPSLAEQDGGLTFLKYKGDNDQIKINECFQLAVKEIDFSKYGRTLADEVLRDWMIGWNKEVIKYLKTLVPEYGNSLKTLQFSKGSKIKISLTVVDDEQSHRLMTDMHKSNFFHGCRITEIARAGITEDALKADLLDLVRKHKIFNLET